MAEDLYVISVDATWALDGGTGGEGPIGVGFTHNDLTVAEVAEALLAQMVDPSDIIARERNRRPVRRVGAFPGSATNEVLFDGVEKRTPIKFVIGDGHQLAMYAINRSNAQLTGGQRIDVMGVIYGKWLR